MLIEIRKYVDPDGPDEELDESGIYECSSLSLIKEELLKLLKKQNGITIEKVEKNGPESFLIWSRNKHGVSYLTQIDVVIARNIDRAAHDESIQRSLLHYIPHNL